MKSPRFDARARPLRAIFSPDNIERIWREKVRVAMRQQYLADGIENFDFHIDCANESAKLSQMVLSGDYIPSRPQRILVEKSKGLCRQLVIPSAADALVLQCLSDALFKQIKTNAPQRAHFLNQRTIVSLKTTPTTAILRHGFVSNASSLNSQRNGPI